MSKLTLEQQEYVDSNVAEINALAEAMWDKLNEINYDPMHPCWDTFDDEIKDKFIEGATTACLSLQLLDKPHYP